MSNKLMRSSLYSFLSLSLSLSLSSLLLFVLYTPSILADKVSQEFIKEKAYTQSIRQSVLTTSLAQFHPEQDLPDYNPHPEAMNYANHPNSINAQARVKLTTDEEGQAIAQHHDEELKNSTYLIDPHDPQLQTAFLAEEDAENIAEGIPDQYNHCTPYKACENGHCEVTGMTGMICGEKFFCIRGECAEVTPVANQNFGQAIASLAALGEAGKTLENHPTAHVFVGQRLTCSMLPMGFSNCCADKGWGQDMGLSQCSNEEKQLGQAKQKSVALYVGEYCSHKTLGQCTKHKKSYCVFSSKLAIDVQRFGRQNQLHVSFGSAKHSNCRGLTLKELQKIDFDQINFANAAEDLKQHAKLPAVTTTSHSISEKIKQQVNAEAL